MVETVRDSSAVGNNLLTHSQRAMLELTYLNDASTRQKYTVLIAEEIHPKKKAAEYLDKGEFENEMKQVLGDTYGGYDLSESEVRPQGKADFLVLKAGKERQQQGKAAFFLL